ncbi:MAG: lysozyme [Pseudomonadota bacterium]
MEGLPFIKVTPQPFVATASKRLSETREMIAAELIKRWEGLELEAYLCPAGIWTIGYGHTATAKEGMHIDHAKAEKLLRQDMQKFMATVEDVEAKLPRALTEQQAGALISFCYNVGPTLFRRSKSVVGRLKAGDYEGAADGLLLYNKARVDGKLTALRGLTNRREMERATFLANPEPPQYEAPAPTSSQEEEVSDPSDHPAASTTLVAVLLGIVTQVFDQFASLNPMMQIGLGLVIVALFSYIGMERLRKNRTAEIG